MKTQKHIYVYKKHICLCEKWFITDGIRMSYLVGSVEKTNNLLYGKECSCITILFQMMLHLKCINVLKYKEKKCKDNRK